MLLDLKSIEKLHEVLTISLECRNSKYKKFKKFNLYIKFFVERTIGFIVENLEEFHELNKYDIKIINSEFKLLLKTELLNCVLNFTKKNTKSDMCLILELIEDTIQILDIIKNNTTILNPKDISSLHETELNILLTLLKNK